MSGEVRPTHTQGRGGGRGVHALRDDGVSCARGVANRSWTPRRSFAQPPWHQRASPPFLLFEIEKCGPSPPFQPGGGKTRRNHSIHKHPLVLDLSLLAPSPAQAPEKNDEQEFQTGPLSVLTQSVKTNSQVPIECHAGPISKPKPVLYPVLCHPFIS
jgi:hypothetical protein